MVAVTALVSLMALCATSALEIPDNFVVPVMDIERYAKFLNVNPYMLVLFFTWNDQHCHKFSPMYKEIFFELDQYPISVVQVDASIPKNEPLMDTLNVQGWPTLKLVHRNGAPHEEYTGERSVEAIVDWVEDRLGVNSKWPLFLEHWYTLQTDISETPKLHRVAQGNMTVTADTTFEEVRETILRRVNREGVRGDVMIYKDKASASVINMEGFQSTDTLHDLGIKIGTTIVAHQV